MPVSLKPIAFATAAFLLVVALWHVFRPQAPERQAPIGARLAEATSSADGAPGPAASNPAPGKDVFDLVLRDGKLASGESVIQVHQGEQVVLRISSNATDELHLHGYDLHARIIPQETAVLEFSANRTGRFTLELHEAQTELGALEVYPR
jgi:hypothetical protein